MSQPVQGPDGNLYQFPDGTTKDQAIAYFRNKGIGVSAKGKPAPKPEDRTFGNYASETARGVGRGVANLATGLYQSFRHPRETAQAVADQADIAQQKAWEDFNARKGEGVGRGVSAALTFAENAPIIGGMVQREEEGYNGTVIPSPEEVGATAEAVTSFGVAPYVAGKMTNKLVDTVKSARETALRTATKTGPRLTRKVVEETQGENEKIAERNRQEEKDTTRKNTERAEKHQGDVQDALHDTQGREIQHKAEVAQTAEEIRTREASETAKAQAELEKSRAEVRKANEEARRVAEKKTADAKEKHEAQVAEHQRLTEATNQLNANDATYKAQLQETERRVHQEADDLYEELKPKINETEADPERVRGIVDSAIGEMGPASSEPALIMKLRKASENDVLTYGDLDGFRSLIGRELRRGTLPGDVYHIYEVAQDGIVDEMTRIAESKGLTKEAGAARSAWREWAQAFRDRKSPLRQILADPETHGLFRRLRYKEVSGIGVIRKFNPKLADAIQSGLNLMDEIRAPRGRSPLDQPKPLGAAPEPVQPKLTPEPTAPPKRLTAGSPEERAAQQTKQPDRVAIPDRPTELKPELEPKKVLTPEELSRRKVEAAKANAEKLWNSSSHLATVFVVLDTVRKLNPFNFNPGGAAIDVGSRLAYGAGKNAFANYLESPKVLNAVGKITAKDVAEVMKLPADQRAGFDSLVLQAQARGVNLKPGVVAAVLGVSAPELTRGLKTKELKRLRDSHAYTDRSSAQQ